MVENPFPAPVNACRGFLRRVLNLALLVWVASAFGTNSSAMAADFTGQRIFLVVGTEAGGGTDTTGRLLTPYFEKYLPGHPTVVVRNMPGASGITAINYVHLQTKRDGLTVMVGSNSQVNPFFIAKAKGQYAPEKFRHIGGLGRGGSVLLIATDAVPRLTDKNAPPVNYGVIDPSRSAAQTAMWGIEYLGWNVKWVAGYRGAADTTVALERGELDMNATGNFFLVQRMVNTGKFKILTQQGEPENGRYVGRAEFGDAPVFADLIEGKITDPLAKQAYNYWESVIAVDKWVALAEDTPEDLANAYRAAFQRMIKDPDFIERGKKISEDLAPMSHIDMEKFIGQMAGVTEETEIFIKNLLRKQGLRIEG